MRCRIALVPIAILALAFPARAENVKVGLSRLLGYVAIPVGIEHGYFKQQGLDVEMVFFDSAQPISVGVASGDIDFGVSGMSAGFYNLAGQGQLKLIAASAGEAPGFHAMAYLASPKAYSAGLTSPKDLGGHSVAVTQLGTSLHYSIAVAAERFGFPMSSVTVKPLQSNTNVIAALGGGMVDAAVLPETTAAAAIQKGDAKFIGWVSDLSTSLVSASACFTSARTANTRIEMVKRFLVAYRQAVTDFRAAFMSADDKRHDGPTAPAMLKLMEDFTGTSQAEIERTMPYMAPDGAIDAGSIDTQIAWYKSQNLIKSDVKAADIIDIRYATLIPHQ
ncbi:MAG TPA: ABC transporter substrate-binding protein [Stellaceae bacterium]|jgi:NitT/TauT family transport system substrate-binding protein